jgi:hypothetical protein
VKVTARHLDATFAATVARGQADRAGTGRSADRSVRWAADHVATEVAPEPDQA